MAVKIRLTRYGAKKNPYYRVIAVDSREKRDGKYIELLGTYNPITKPATVNLDEEKIIKWLGNGAIPTDTVRDLLSKAGIMKKIHDNKTVSAKPKKEETTKEEKPKTTTKKTTKKVGK